jgi:DNA-binding transcriptional LysR family regulator
MLEVGRLRALLAMSEHGGSSGAARALGRPVAGELSDWERELGLPLVDGDQLTPAGRRLAEHAGTLLGQLESAESEAAAVAGRVAGTLRLGVGADAGRVLLAETLGALRSTDVRLHVRQLADERVAALDGTLDAVVVGEYGAAVPQRPDPAVERRELFTEPLLLAVPSRHRATGASVRLAELAGEAWIAGAGDTQIALERAAAGAGFAPRVVAEVGEDALALTLVAAGLGVTLVPASAAPSPAEGVRFLTVLDGGLRRTVVAAVRRTRAVDPAVRRLLDALAAAARRVAAAVPGVTAAIAPSSAPSAPDPRRPDPLFDPLPPERSNGRRDPWADRVRPEGLDLPGRNGTNGTDLPPRNGTPAFGSFSADLPGRPAPGPADPLGGPADLPGRNGFPAPNGTPGRPTPDLSGSRSDDRLGSAAGDRPGSQDQPGRPGPTDFSGATDFSGSRSDDLLGSPVGDHPGSRPSDLLGSRPTDLAGSRDLPGRPSPTDLPGSQAGDLPGRQGSTDLPGPRPSDFSGSRPGELPGWPGPADMPGSRPTDRSGLGGRADLSGPRAADLPGSREGDLPGRGGLPGRDVPADLPGRNSVGRRPGSRGGDALSGEPTPPGTHRPAEPLGADPLSGPLPPAGSPDRPTGPRTRGAPAEADDLAGMSGLSGFSGPRRGAVGGDEDLRRSGLTGGGALPPPGGLPAPGADVPARGGASPYRTPPPTGDAPDFTPDLPSRSGPNPYRQDPSEHPTPDPFRSAGSDAGPNPYRASLGGSELFTASQRPGAALPPPGGDAAPTRRSRVRGGDDASLPPAPAGAAEDVRLSIFEDLQSEWFVQREGGTKAEPWRMAADDGWAAAARLAEPTTAGTTTAGLPRRRPQAMVVPGAVGAPGAEEHSIPTHRSPQEVRGRLSSYRDGVRRGRHAQRTTDEE